MNPSSAASYVIWFFVYVFVQAFILSDVAIFGVFFCFFYVGYLLKLPFSISPIYLLFIAFAQGFIIDIFFNSIGQHTATLVLVAFLRPYWLLAIKPQGGYENISLPSVRALGIRWFCIYAGPLLLAHHLVIFSIEIGNFNHMGGILLKTFCSSLFTLLSLLGIEYLGSNKKRLS